MIRHRRRQRMLAACLSAIAGYVDALGFIDLGGFFVSFMSGNSTRLGVGLIDILPQAEVAATLIALFVVGVIAGTFVGSVVTIWREGVILASVATLLAAAALLDRAHLHAAAIGALVLAMGAENAVFERDGEVSIGVTYMTGTLVKLGQRITQALLGGAPFAWAWYLMLWIGLVLGAMAGAVAYPHLGLQGVWFAGGATALLAVLATFCGFPPADRDVQRTSSSRPSDGLAIAARVFYPRRR